MPCDPAEVFASTAPATHRNSSSCLVDRFDLDDTRIVLDLGCGTGQLAIPLAPTWPE